MTKSDEIRNWIVKNIRSGAFPADKAIPTRHRIMRRFNVARSTVDRVIKELIADGHLHSVRGGGTYASSPPNERSPLLYIISDWTSDYSESHSLIVDHLDEIEGLLDYVLLDSRRMEKMLSDILKKATRLIWDRPKLTAAPFFKTFEEAGIAQLIVNRSFGTQNSITTDTAAGIREGMDFLLKTSDRKARCHVVAPRIDHFLPFLTERELAFHEYCVNAAITIANVERYQSRTIVSSRLGACAKSLSRIRKNDIYFLPYSRDLSHLLSVAREKGLYPGKDFKVLTWDEADEYGDMAGLIFLENPWDEMYRSAFRWAKDTKASNIADQIKPKMVVTPTT